MRKKVINYISKDSVLKNNTLGNNIKIYKNSEVRDSNIGDYVTIGDFAIVKSSELLDHISINRRNQIYHSNIGRYSYTGSNTMIRYSLLGNFCSVSWNVSIGGGEHPQNNVTTSTLENFHFLDSGRWDEKVKSEIDYYQGECTIGNDVWIAANVVILRNVKIGNGAIIGAGAVVTKDVEPYSIAVGVPAKTIKKRFNDKTIEALEEIQWWNWSVDIIRNNLDLIYSTKVDDMVIDKLLGISNTVKIIN